MPTFKDDDFVAFMVYAGIPPTMDYDLRSAKLLQRRLDYVTDCTTFCDNYFDLKYPDSDWLDFYSGFLNWLKEKDDASEEMDLFGHAVARGISSRKRMCNKALPVR